MGNCVFVIVWKNAIGTAIVHKINSPKTNMSFSVAAAKPPPLTEAIFEYDTRIGLYISTLCGDTIAHMGSISWNRHYDQNIEYIFLSFGLLFPVPTTFV